MRFAVLVAALVVLGCSKGQQETPDKPTEPSTKIAADPKAIAVLEESAAAYRSLETYQDEILIASSGRNMMPRQAFGRTLYANDGRFLFEVSSQDPYGSGTAVSRVWTKDGKVYVTSFMNSGKKESSIFEALQSITEPSAFASILVPSLLLHDEFPNHTLFARMKAPQLEKEVEFAGETFFHVVDPGGYSVLISKKSKLIKRILLPNNAGMVDIQATANEPLTSFEVGDEPGG